MDTRKTAEPNNLTQISVKAIQERPYGDLMPVKLANIVMIAESIASVGLKTAVRIDPDNFLISGATRVAAFRLLRITPEKRIAWLMKRIKREKVVGELTPKLREQIEGLGVRKLMVKCSVASYRVQENPEKARFEELTENVVRSKHPNRAEIRALFHRFVELGYSSKVGRPKKGAPGSARQLIMTRFGISDETLRSLLKDEDQSPKPPSRKLTLKQSISIIRTLIKKISSCDCDRSARRYLENAMSVLEAEPT